MGDKTGIAWTNSTWNPIRGCTKVSSGCDNCYAMSVAYRFSGEGEPYEGLARKVNGRPAWTNVVREVPEHLEDPLRWQRPRMIFVNSMSDLFHDQVTDGYIARVFAIMAISRRHTFQVLTKRPQRMATLLGDFRFRSTVYRAFDALFDSEFDLSFLKRDPDWVHRVMGELWPLENVWLGVSVENQVTADDRIPYLLQTPAAIRFLSCEPLLGPVDLREAFWEEAGPAWAGENRADPSPDWVIVGGESGPRAQPMHPQWARSLRDECAAAAVPFFFKQWGEYVPLKGQLLDVVSKPLVGISPDSRVKVGKDGLEAGDELMARVGTKAAGHLLDGTEWHQFPQTREMGIRE